MPANTGIDTAHRNGLLRAQAEHQHQPADGRQRPQRVHRDRARPAWPATSDRAARAPQHGSGLHAVHGTHDADQRQEGEHRGDGRRRWRSAARRPARSAPSTARCRDRTPAATSRTARCGPCARRTARRGSRRTPRSAITMNGPTPMRPAARRRRVAHARDLRRSCCSVIAPRSRPLIVMLSPLMADGDRLARDRLRPTIERHQRSSDEIAPATDRRPEEAALVLPELAPQQQRTCGGVGAATGARRGSPSGGAFMRRFPSWWRRTGRRGPALRVSPRPARLRARHAVEQHHRLAERQAALVDRACRLRASSARSALTITST